MGKASRDKGKRYERIIAAYFRDAIPAFASRIRRGWQAAGADGVEADVKGVPGLWIECKHRKSLSYRAHLQQAIDDSEGSDGLIPIAICRRDRDFDTVTLKLDDFINFYQAWLDKENKID